ncbi:MAG: signal peptidase I [Geminicoccaceae bacterium]|nr:signal peptidase I [Geminicoccaceae bacterium]
MTESRSSSFKETLRTLVYAIAIALFVRTFAYEPFNIPSGSMKPTLLVGDYLFVSKFSYGYSKYSLPLSIPLFEGRIFGDLPERGDVAVFKLPSDNKTDYIKRIVGLPGDRLQMIDGILNINGTPVEVRRLGNFLDDERGRLVEEPLYLETLPNGVDHQILDLTSLGALDNTKVFEVPEGHVFAMGDNRDNSLDSRTDQVSFVPLENLIGRADFLLFSVNGSARIWEPWKWPWAIRYDRLFRPIH